MTIGRTPCWMSCNAAKSPQGPAPTTMAEGAELTSGYTRSSNVSMLACSPTSYTSSVRLMIIFFCRASIVWRRTWRELIPSGAILRKRAAARLSLASEAATSGLTLSCIWCIYYLSVPFSAAEIISLLGRIYTSTRRLAWRPATVVLSATGSLLPLPAYSMRLLVMPWLAR